MRLLQPEWIVTSSGVSAKQLFETLTLVPLELAASERRSEAQYNHVRRRQSMMLAAVAFVALMSAASTASVSPGMSKACPVIRACPDVTA
jgi:hypothetical protein